MHKLMELKVWNKAMELATDIYKATENFPTEEKFGLTSQIRRAAVSIPSNISEGAGRNSNREFYHFLGIANGSSFELQTQIILANRLGLMKEDWTKTLLAKIDEIQKMNIGFQKKLNKT